MVLTASTMLPLGTQAPSFDLPDVVTGRNVQLKDFDTQTSLLVMFICQHCPYVQHVKEQLAKLSGDYKGKGLAIVGISSNDATKYPDDSPQALKKFAQASHFDFPLLFDDSQEIAKAYTAACTPDFFLFDKSRKLVYRGQLDDSRPESGKPVTGQDLRAAIEAVLNNRHIPAEQRPSIGCNIKWKAGNEPPYFR